MVHDASMVHGRCMVHGAYSVHGPGRGCHDVQAEREPFFVGGPLSMAHPMVHGRCMVHGPASILWPEQQALWGQVSASGSVRAGKDASISRLNGRFFEHAAVQVKC